MIQSLQAKLNKLQKAVQKQELVFSSAPDVYADFVDNSVLPVVWAKEDGSIIYSNKAMDEMIGCQVSGKNASSYYFDQDERVSIQERLNSSNKINGLNVTLQKCDGQTIYCRLFTSIHRDKDGNWINTRCIFVPNS